MDETYNPGVLEPTIQAYWSEQQRFKTTEDIAREKYYCLSMLPYPSGQLHMGHVRNYTIGDAISRYQTILGKNVLQPMGWDAFGLPAENAAIKHKRSPAVWTENNIEQMRTELQSLGLAIDWSRELKTCDPDYYRWEQWLFVKLFNKGLAYRKKAVVNWDPVDQTVLANEQVIDGKGWRSGALVERREISQWFLKITAYADELLNGLDTLTEWPQQVISMQRHWIGRSEGTDITFKIEDHADKLRPLSIYTTCAHTLYGVTFIVIAPEHPIAEAAAASNPDLAAFVETCRHIKVAEAEVATIEKVGMNTGFAAIHPLTGDKLPIWVANYVLMEYGHGAVMAVPAHDQRDFEFAQQYGLAIQSVVKPAEGETVDDNAAYIGPGTLINSGEFDGLGIEEGVNAISDYLVEQQLGERRTRFRLRDWGVSRQRYWGCPIPMIHCPECGIVPVPEEDLPVVLPTDVVLSGPSSPLKNMPSFYETVCPACDHEARRETDTFDTFVESSWYYARYCCPDQHNAMLDDKARYWTPVDQYIGGIEHAVMHLLYARFMHKLLRDEGLVNSDEPFKRLLSQGMVLKDGVKMSKSKGNTVAPDELIKQYGADAIRVFILFAAPPEQSLEWSDEGIEGAYRFLRRLWSFAHSHHEVMLSFHQLDEFDAPREYDDTLKQLRNEIHAILNKATFDANRQQWNTVVSASMKLLNVLTKFFDPKDVVSGPNYLAVLNEGLSILLRVLSPIAPHITHHLWQALGYGEDILVSGWPKIDNKALKTETISYVIQVNGKVRSQISIPHDADDEAIERVAVDDEKVQRSIENKAVKKIIIVPKKLVNIVV